MRWPRRSCGTAGGAHSSRVARQLNERSRETLGFETRAERDLMLVLHRPIEPTVKSGHSTNSGQCPLYPRKRTSELGLRYLQQLRSFAMFAAIRARLVAARTRNKSMD